MVKFRFLLLATLCLGCQGNADPANVGTTFPVEGKILLVADGEESAPVKIGTVAFHPDKSKGNTCPHTPGAEIQADGSFRLITAAKPGAPAGWYKVVVVSTEPPNPDDPFAPRKSFIDEKYNTAETTELEIEVVAGAAPGSYDLKVQAAAPQGGQP
ncbi:MAG: hypothetical protein AB7K24_10025 [Gemmataceae bacterium]